MKPVFETLLILMTLGIHKSKQDRLIERILINAYNFRTFIGDHIRANSRDGIVTLKGRVSGRYEKDLASRTATSVSSVLGVENKLVIAQPSARVDDEALLVKCRKRLAVVAVVNVRSITLSVCRGRVTLEGMVDTERTKELINIRLREIEGVESVENRAMLQLDNYPIATVQDQIDDVSISGLIKLGLLQEPMTRSLSLKVDTLEGDVAIRGEAVMARQIHKVSEIASLFIGVRAVSNEMTLRGCPMSAESSC